MNDLDVMQSARDYIARDLPIIPVCSHDHSGMSASHRERCKSPGKSPILKAWSDKDSTTEAEIKEWFGGTTKHNVGMVLGQSNNWNIMGVDIDGDLGQAQWAQLSEEHKIPDTWEFITGGGGHRLLFTLPDGMVTKKKKVWYDEGHQEVAFIAEGQQTIMPPSIHESGTKYLWVTGKSPRDIDIAEAPSWIVDLIQVSSGPEDIPNFYGGAQSKPVTMLEYNQNTWEGSRSEYMARFVGSLCAKRELPKDTIIATAMQQNLIHCKPPLEQSAIEAMVESIWQAEQNKHQQMLERQRVRAEMNPAVLAELFFKEQLDKGIYWRYYSERSTFYRTQVSQSPWLQLTEDQIEADIQMFLLSQDPSIATSSKRLEVIRALRIYIMVNYGDGAEFDVGKHPNLKFIAVPNGLLDWRSGELKPWDPKYRHTALIEANWCPEEAPKSNAMNTWLEALHSWLPDEDTIMFLQEYIGYSLLPSCKMRTAVFLYGEGANGKSLFIDVVLKLFEQSYAVAQPSSLTGRFGTTSLIDKMVIVCSDIDAAYLDRTGVLKQIIAGDEIRAEYKGGKDFGFTPIGKMLFSANKLPKSSDRSYGWYSRLQFVPFPHRFKPDQTYYKNLMDVMDSDEGRSALLHWAVEGLQRVTKAGGWTVSRVMAEAKNEYRRDNDSVMQFADSHLMPHPIASEGYKTSLVLKSVYATYRDWCEQSGVKPVSQGECSSRLSQAGFEKKPLRWKIGDKWKTVISLVDTAFREETEFEAEIIYESYQRVAL